MSQVLFISHEQAPPYTIGLSAIPIAIITILSVLLSGCGQRTPHDDVSAIEIQVPAIDTRNDEGKLAPVPTGSEKQREDLEDVEYQHTTSIPLMLMTSLALLPFEVGVEGLRVYKSPKNVPIVYKLVLLAATGKRVQMAIPANGLIYLPTDQAVTLEKTQWVGGCLVAVGPVSSLSHVHIECEDSLLKIEPVYSFSGTSVPQSIITAMPLRLQDFPSGLTEKDMLAYLGLDQVHDLWITRNSEWTAGDIVVHLSENDELRAAIDGRGCIDKAPVFIHYEELMKK